MQIWESHHKKPNLAVYYQTPQKKRKKKKEKFILDLSLCLLKTIEFPKFFRDQAKSIMFQKQDWN